MTGRGRFITLEGGEGAGKSTQASRLADWLRARGHDVIETREPGGTVGAEAIRGLLLSGEGDRWTAESEVLLFAAARADHVARLIRPALASGRWVVCDRFIDSSIAYQGVAGGLGIEQVVEANRLALGNLMPDLTLLLELPAGMAESRARLRDGDAADRIAARGGGFHRRVAEAFDDLAAANADRIVRIDAAGDPDSVATLIRARVAEKLPWP